jgi:hypothetical protein
MRRSGFIKAMALPSRELRLEHGDLIESLDPLSVAFYQNLGGEHLGRQRLALEAAFEVGGEGPQRSVVAKEGNLHAAHDLLLPFQLGQRRDLIVGRLRTLPGRAALLVIDVQNATCGPKQKAEKPEFYLAATLRVIPNISRLLAAFRSGRLEGDLHRHREFDR